MQASTLAQLAVNGILAASVPLSMVWMSSDPNRYRKLVWTIAFLTFDLIVFGAFTRLTDSGLGCPDWPGCYGLANPFLAHEHIAAAEALMPSGPVTTAKAWIEMIHRYLAMGIGFLIITLLITATVQWRRRGARSHAHAAVYHPLLPAVLLGWVCVQGAFGAWTVTLKLQPVIVTLHLLFGMTLLALVVWLGGRTDAVLGMPTYAAPSVEERGALRRLRPLAWLSGAVLLAQLALGGWVSTNYAALACSGFPLCNGAVVPDMDFGHGFTLWRELGKTAAGHYLPFQALTAIQWVHRHFALVVVLVLGYTAWRAWSHAGLRATARHIVLTLAAQVAFGVATVFLDRPLAIATLHNAGAATLVLLVTMLNYKIQYRLGPPRSNPSSQGSQSQPAAAAASHS
jgi:cytochrome c oxidase assembly protein subunit 15